MQLIQFWTSRPPCTKTGLLQTYRMYVHCSREWTEKEEGEKKSQRGKEESLLISLCSVPTRFGRLAGQATRYRLRRNRPRLICQNRVLHTNEPDTSHLVPLPLIPSLLHWNYHMYQTFSLTLRDDGDPKQIVQNVSAWLSHKKFNTTNGLNGRVVTGTHVSLEFLQINR